MGHNMYFYQKEREEHFQDLLREAEKERLLAQLPRRRSISRRTAGKLSILLFQLASQLKQFEQSSGMLELL